MSATGRLRDRGLAEDLADLLGHHDRLGGIEMEVRVGGGADLEGGLPLASRSVDHQFAVHVLEHIFDPVGLMNEVHRVLHPDGVVHLLLPHWRHPNAVADPTHVRYYGAETFQWFCRDRPGVSCFRPLSVSATDDTVFADLRAVEPAEAPAPEVLARWFD